MKIKKRKKSSRMHGKGRGTHGWGERKKHKKKGHRGGKGMSGTGKRADHKKTLITKVYGHSYFGKKGVTSRGSEKNKEKKINLDAIQKNMGNFGNTKGKLVIDLKDHKILGKGELKTPAVIHAKKASKSAIEKVKKAGGEIVLGLEKRRKKLGEE